MHEIIIQICFVVAGVVTGCTDGVAQTDNLYLSSQDLSPVYVYDVPSAHQGYNSVGLRPVHLHHRVEYIVQHHRRRAHRVAHQQRLRATRIARQHHRHVSPRVRVVHRHHHPRHKRKHHRRRHRRH